MNRLLMRFFLCLVFALAPFAPSFCQSYEITEQELTAIETALESQTQTIETLTTLEAKQKRTIEAQSMQLQAQEVENAKLHKRCTLLTCTAASLFVALFCALLL